MKNILITGASGFVGGHMVEEGNRRGYKVFAGVRGTSDLRFLEGQQYEIFPLDLNKPHEVRNNLIDFRNKGIEFNYVIHCAAITKPKRIEEFYEGNSEFTKTFASELIKEHPSFKKFIYISSMAAQGPGDSVTFAPVTEEHLPKPFTPYGMSKRRAELYLFEMKDLNYVIFRPMAVYGPRDKKFILRLISIMQKGFNVSLGSSKAKSAIVYIDDITELLFNAIESDVVRETFNISDGKTYPQATINRVLSNELGLKTVSLRIPRWFLLGVSYTLYFGNKIIKKPLHLSPFKIKELTALNWTVDISKAQKMLRFYPKHFLDKGVKKTVDWYHKNGDHHSAK